MHGLDDIGWDYGFAVSAYGARIGARVNDLKLLDQLRARTPYGSTHSKAKTVDRLFSVMVIKKKNPKLNRYNLYWDHTLFVKNEPLESMLDKFDAIASLAIAELSDEKLFVHAGVVEWKNKAILIPGKSHSGKSTLVAELVKCGATYYSDEFAVIDRQGYVTAYPKPLSLREPGKHIQKDVPIEDIGGKVGNRRLPVGLIVISQYEKGSNWEPEYLSPGNGLLHILENTHSILRTPKRAIQYLKKLVTYSKAIRCTRGEASEVAPKILHEVAIYHDPCNDKL